MRDINNLGMGVMINMLAEDGSTAKAIKESFDKTISKVELIEDILYFRFTDDTTLKVYDDGQSCCESRYMMTDDDLSYYTDCKLLNMELKNGPDETNKYGECHEVQFLDVTTSKGTFQMASHNEHNGYYGGFYILAEII